ncbi:Cassette chromosome recombinase B [Bacillus cereus]|nr:Cassette chromosome recombinase B [Bacillus cereus]
MGSYIRVAIYARVSTEEQAEHGYSIDAQLDTLRNYCKMYGKIAAQEYVDRGVSGKSIKGRYELQKLLRDAKNGEFDEVIVWKISRLARKTIDLLQIVDELSKHKVAFRSFSENFETETPMGKFALQMMGAVGELERNTIVDNVKMGMKQRARTGKWNGGRVLGYKSISSEKEGKSTQLAIVEKEAVIVRKIFNMYSKGKGLRAIANKINHEGYKTKKGNAFSTATIKEIILNPVYIGKIRFNRYEDWNESRRRGKSENIILIDGKHEPIITKELWNKVQSLQKMKAKKSIKNYEGNFLLTGLLKCPKCGSAMVSSRTTNTLKDGTKRVLRYYSCGAFRSKGSAVCSANSVRADYAEEYVIGRIKEIVKYPTVLKRLIHSINKQKEGSIKPLKDELQVIDKSIQNIENRKKKYFNLYEDSLLDQTMFMDRIRELKEEIERLSARKSEVEFELGDADERILSYEYVKKILSQLSLLLEAAPCDEKKILYHLLIENIIVNDEKKIEYIQLNIGEEIQQELLKKPLSREMDGGFYMSKNALKITI